MTFWIDVGYFCYFFESSVRWDNVLTTTNTAQRTNDLKINFSFFETFLKKWRIVFAAFRIDKVASDVTLLLQCDKLRLPARSAGSFLNRPRIGMQIKFYSVSWIRQGMWWIYLIGRLQIFQMLSDMAMLNELLSQETLMNFLFFLMSCDKNWRQFHLKWFRFAYISRGSNSISRSSLPFNFIRRYFGA